MSQLFIVIIVSVIASVMQENRLSHLKHLVELAKKNAKFHRLKYHETKDRYYLGQWKAYSRIAFRLSRLEMEPS